MLAQHSTSRQKRTAGIEGQSRIHSSGCRTASSPLARYDYIFIASGHFERHEHK